MDGAERLARLFEVAVTTALVGFAGALPVLWVDAVTFLVSAALVGWAVPHVRSVPSASSGYARELREGFDVVRRDALLRAVVLLVFCTNAFDAASGVLLPLVATREWNHPTAFGWISAVFGVGAAIGALTVHRLTARWSRRRVFAVAFLVAGGPRYLLLAAGLPLELALVTFLLSGLAAGALNPLLGAVQLERVEPGMRARVSGFVSAGASAGMPAGAVLAGWTADRAGLAPVLVAVGTAYLLVTLHPVFGRAWREMDRSSVRATAVPG